MKRYIAYLFTFFCSLTWFSAQAQKDSVVVNFSEEKVDSSDFDLKEEYRYITRKMVEEKTLVKVGTSGIGWSGYTGLSSSVKVAYEKKLIVPLSVFLEAEKGLNLEERDLYGGSAALRYYYSLPHKIKKGKSANNFSSNYVSLQYNIERFKGYERYYRRVFATGASAWPETVWLSEKSLFLLYGIQRRIGRFGYLDLNFGPKFIFDPKSNPYTHLRFDINFSIGLGL